MSCDPHVLTAVLSGTSNQTGVTTAAAYTGKNFMDVVRGTALLYLDELLVDRSYTLRELLQPQGVDVQVAGNFEKTLSYKRLVQIFEGSAQALQLPALGMMLASRQKMELLGPQLRALACSAPTLGEGLNTLSHHMQLYSPAIHALLDIHTAPQQPLLSFHNGLPDSRETPQVIEKSILGLPLVVSEMLGKPWKPSQVLFRHAPQVSRQQYWRFFGCEVLFGQSYNGIVLRPADLLRPCAGANPQLYTSILDALAAAGCPGRGICTLVDDQILKLLPHGCATLERVAIAIGIKPRSLERQLAEKGCTFKSRLERVRRQHGQLLLSETFLSIEKIAGELGYLHSESFCRAHARWFGVSPLQQRKKGSN